MRKLAYLLTLIILSLTTFAQDKPAVEFSYDEFWQLVKNHHPVAKQAQLLINRGEANLQKSRGLFDPKLASDLSQKYFDGTNYYDKFHGGLTVPTWFGVELKTAYEKNQGYYLNPESVNPGGGLWYAGISVPIGQGLFIDERRQGLKQAKIYLQRSDAERKVLLNQLMQKAGSVYWDWFRAYYDLLVYEDALALVQERFDALKQSADIGETAYIDTLEASIQLQNRKLSYLQAKLDYQNSKAFLEVYLWADGLVPLEMEENVIPMDLNAVGTSSPSPTSYLLIDSALNTHPEVDAYNLMIQELEVEQRWKREQLKPQLNLKYNPISEPIDGDPFANYSVNNYTWGVNFSIPVFLRKERGELQLNKIKIESKQQDIEFLRQKLKFQATAALNEWETTKNQADNYAQTVIDYRRLLAGEKQLFDVGESSLFMVNRRELGYISAQLKRNELVNKNKKAALATKFAMGTLWQE